jgi:hypothetical protein
MNVRETATELVPFRFVIYGKKVTGCGVPWKAHNEKFFAVASLWLINAVSAGTQLTSVGLSNYCVLLLSRCIVWIAASSSRYSEPFCVKNKLS